ncbi:hypothetical protein P0082_03400 [Candidatus Haliotispira prima]|uniref:Uncharacterized protein n=1 Tax=Candidatus Haliotispira prima TaxID=3034016 RepID=A0ABY8MIS3_9SPIO|nr:hypothetical protein P0082_03400 [Candidatus Haliotispira prima]
MTFSVTSPLEGEQEFTFAVSALQTTSLPAQLGKGYIKRTLTKDVGREVFMAHLNTMPDDINTLTANHFMKENTTYYLHMYRGRDLVSRKSFTTAKFTTLSTLERRQGANNVGIHSWDQYFPSNGKVIGTDRGTLSTPKTSTEESSPKKIEVKKEEYLVLPMRAVVPILAEPSPITSTEETEIYLFQVKVLDVLNGGDPIFTYFNGSNPPVIGDGNVINSTTICLETSQTKSVNFDAYLSCIITIPTSDPAVENSFVNGEFGLEFVNQLNAANYIGIQKVINVKLIIQ